MSKNGKTDCKPSQAFAGMVDRQTENPFGNYPEYVIAQRARDDFGVLVRAFKYPAQAKIGRQQARQAAWESFQRMDQTLGARHTARFDKDHCGVFLRAGAVMNAMLVPTPVDTDGQIDVMDDNAAHILFDAMTLQQGLERFLAYVEKRIVNRAKADQSQPHKRGRHLTMVPDSQP